MKKLLIGSLAVGMLALGEYVRPYKSLKQMILFYQVPTASDFPKDPWNYSLERKLYDYKGTTYQTLHLVNTTSGIERKIDERGCTCGLQNTVDDAVYDARTWFEKQIEKSKEWFND